MHSETPPTRRTQGVALLERTEYRLVETAEDRDAVYRLRYRAYLDSGLIEPSAAERVCDRYDEASNARIFAVHVDGELCGAVRLHVLTSDRRDCWATQLYGDVLHPRLDRGEVFVDASRLVADPDKGREHPELALVTLRLAYLACDHFDADFGIAMVRTDHQPFYRRFFRHETIAEPRAFPDWPTRKTVLMTSDFRAFRDQVAARFPIMRSNAAERRALFGGLHARTGDAPAEAAE